MIFFSDLSGFFNRDHGRGTSCAQGMSTASNASHASAGLEQDNAWDVQRRRLMVGGTVLGVGLTMLPLSGRAQEGGPPALEADPAEAERIIATFLQDAQPVEKGLKLDMAALADNPASVPIKVVLEEAVTPESYCKELIVIAEGNPRPLACRFHFTPLVGNIDVGIRLRLIGSQSIRAMARMNDGRVLMVSQHVVVTAGGCGM